MVPDTRLQEFQTLFPDEPSFRIKQVQEAFFLKNYRNWNDLLNLPKEMRKTLEHKIAWQSLFAVKIFVSEKKDTHKAILQTQDKHKFESVLMKNKKGDWTICVSSQIGCAMKCSFCATGTMGIKRNLSSDEIGDQYRFWNQYIQDSERISNIVFMGMGEPLANYENVRTALNQILQFTDIGATKITVSTVSLLPQLQKILSDKQWPHVRLAVSLHAPNDELRKKIVPTSAPEFMKKIALWAHEYQEILGNRKHHLTFQYILLAGVNDSRKHALELAKYVNSIGHVKVNVIPYNTVKGKEFGRSQINTIENFKLTLREKNVQVSQRKTMGDDINAACGQLVLSQPQRAE